jgi:hypothetical protein
MIISTDRTPLDHPRRAVCPVFYPPLGNEGVRRSICAYESGSHGHHTCIENGGVPGEVGKMSVRKAVGSRRERE